MRVSTASSESVETVYFAMRWLNAHGQFGPWSQVYSATIPS
jgi:hypothetical protein